MRKFTLLFMSMFLVLGTTMAKDEDTKEDKGFTLVSAQPSSDKPVQAVDYINLGFSKNIVVTLPEEKIEIKSNDGKEVFEIVNAMVADANVMFLLQKVVVSNDEEKQTEKKDDKGDDEETAITYISTPGTYSYTIPEGVIKSVDNEVFPETTLTFTIAAPAAKFPIKDYSPKETPELKEIVVTFDEEITEVKLGSAAVLESSWWSYMSNFSNFTISEDKKSVTLTLTTPITTIGNYLVEFYAGTFISTNGENEYGKLDFKVIDPEPGFETNYKDGDKVKVGEFGNFEISFKNVEVVELKKTEFTVLNLTAQSSITGTAAYSEETKKITVTLSQELTQEGNYVFSIPAGMFTMDGIENEAKAINIELYSFEIIPLEIESVTPEVGTVDQIEKITIKFNQPVRLYYDKDGKTPSNQIVLKCGEKEYVLLNDYSNDLTTLVYTTDEWTGTEWASNPITTEGVYTLDLSSIIINYGAEDIIDQYGYPDKKWHEQNYSLEGTYTWTVSGNAAAIENVPVAEGEQEIYDLLGRRVERINGAGIYIVNGKKVVIK